MRKIERWVAAAVVGALLVLGGIYWKHHAGRGYVVIENAWVDESACVCLEAGKTTVQSTEPKSPSSKSWYDLQRSESGNAVFAIEDGISRSLGSPGRRGPHEVLTIEGQVVKSFSPSIHRFSISPVTKECEQSVVLTTDAVRKQFGPKAGIATLKAVSADGARLLVEVCVSGSGMVLMGDCPHELWFYDIETRAFSEVKP